MKYFNRDVNTGSNLSSSQNIEEWRDFNVRVCVTRENESYTSFVQTFKAS